MNKHSLGILAIIAAVIWYFWGKTKTAEAAGTTAGYVPPNDPSRINSDPTLNAGSCPCSSTTPGTATQNSSPQVRARFSFRGN